MHYYTLNNDIYFGPYFSQLFGKTRTPYHRVILFSFLNGIIENSDHGMTRSHGMSKLHSWSECDIQVTDGDRGHGVCVQKIL